MARKPGFHLKSGYVVIAIPASGLFVKDGNVVTGLGRKLAVDEMILFSRKPNADAHAGACKAFWKKGDSAEPGWEFPVMPVLVSEHL